MCGKSKLNGLIFVIALYTLIQSAIYTILSLIGIFTFRCEIEMNENQLLYLWYLMYFRDGECHKTIDWSKLGIIIDTKIKPPEPIWPNLTEVAFRTNIFLFISCSLNTLWAVTSILLMIGVCVKRVGKFSYFLLFQLWIIVSVFVFLFDCVSTGFYIYDITSTLTINSLLHFLNIENINEFEEFLSNQLSDMIIFIPSLIMTLISFRGIVFLLINFYCIIMVGFYGKNHVKSRKSARDTINVQRPDFGYDYSNWEYRNRIGTSNETLPDSSEMRYKDQSQLGYENNHINYLENRTDRPYNSEWQLRNPSNHHGNDNLNIYLRSQQMELNEVKSTSRINEIKNNFPNFLQKSNSVQYKRSNIPRNSLEKRRSSVNKVPSSDSGLVSLKSQSSMNSNYDHEQQLNLPSVSTKPERFSNQIPGGVLRNQLPWSYTSNPDSIHAPKRILHTTNEVDLAPPIPVPDYTLHFSKQKRPSLERNDLTL